MQAGRLRSQLRARDVTARSHTQTEPQPWERRRPAGIFAGVVASLVGIGSYSTSHQSLENFQITLLESSMPVATRRPSGENAIALSTVPCRSVTHLSSPDSTEKR